VAWTQFYLLESPRGSLTFSALSRDTNTDQDAKPGTKVGETSVVPTLRKSRRVGQPQFERMTENLGKGGPAGQNKLPQGFYLRLTEGLLRARYC
jgi:hypothetical protein